MNITINHCNLCGKEWVDRNAFLTLKESKISPTFNLKREVICNRCAWKQGQLIRTQEEFENDVQQNLL